jgi:hypothetical protein
MQLMPDIVDDLLELLLGCMMKRITDYMVGKEACLMQHQHNVSTHYKRKM